MSKYRLISIDITVTAAHESEYVSAQSIPPLNEQLRCEQFYGCSSEYCFKHGCLNALPHKEREVRS
jgi:hypothetical protein